MTISSKRRVACGLVVMALSVFGAKAHAEPSGADLANARTMFKQGEALRASGDLQGALTSLRGAHELAHTPITGVELGGVYEQLGQLTRARDVWREVSRMPEAPNESAATRRARADVAARLGPLEARIPSVEIAIEGAVTSVAIDGTAIPITSLKGGVSLDPGVHTIAANGDAGVTRSARIELAEGVQMHLALDLSSRTPPAVVVDRRPLPLPLPAEAPRSETNSRALFWTGLGVTGAGLVVGGITGGLALSKKADVAAACPDMQCPPSSQSDIDASKAFGNVSTVAFVVAGVGAALVIVALVRGGAF